MKNLLRIGMLLCSFLLASVGWTMAEESGGSAKNVINPDPATAEGGVVNSTNGLLSARYLKDKCGTGSQESEISVFANGNEVKVYEEDNTLYISTFNGNDIFGFTNKVDGFYAVRLYGGRYEANVEGGTKITLESGAIRNIYGGGRSDNPNQPANVSGMARINVSAGSFSLVCGGGRYYAKTNEAAICIGTKENPYAETSNYIIAGGMDQGYTSNSTNKYSSTLNDNVNAVNTVRMDIYGGTFSVIGAGGGNGYTHTGTSTVNLTNVTVNKFYGVYSNGIADNVTVTMTGGSINQEFASINRGKLVNGSFTTTNTTFGNDVKAYIGATSGWANSDTNGDPAPVVTGKLFYSLDGLQEIYLGEGLADATFEVHHSKVKVAKFYRGSKLPEGNRYLNAFTINTNGRWTANAGMTFGTGDDTAALTNDGNLSVGPVDADHINDLYALFEAGVSGIVLEGKQNAPYILSKQLVIKKPMTLYGNGATLQADPKGDWPKKSGSDEIDTSKANLISIVAGQDAEVRLENINVMNSKAAGINVQTAKKVTLTGGSSKENATAGLLVHAPVEASGFQTAYNAWGGVNIDKGKNGADTYDYNPSFTFNESCSFAESNQIWSELAEKEATEIVTLPESNTTWRAIKGKSDDGKKNMWFWTNAKLTQETIGGITYVYANGNPVTVSAGEAGKTTITSDIQVLTFDDSTDEVYLFGGSKNANVESTNITMNGGQLAQIYGGGLATSDEVVANVGTATINITGGEISDALTPGGVRRSKVTSATVTVTGSSEDAKMKVNTFVVGGFASPGTKNRVNTWESANCGVQTATITLKNVEIQYMGAGGGQGYSYTGSTNVSVENATINSAYGTLYNGYADDIEASFKNVNFSGEFATINRGAVGSADFTFDGCTLNANAINCIGAATGWAGSDTNGSDAPEVSGSVTYTFTNMSTVPTIYVGEGLTNANVTVTGAPVQIAKFDKGKPQKPVAGFEQYLAAFEIAAGKTWTFNGGLSFAPDESQVTLTTNGTLIIPAVYVPALVSNANDGISVTLTDQEMATVVNGMNNADNKTDLSGKSISIECKDGVIASNKDYAAELAAMGKLVKVLSYTAEGGYSLSTETVQEAAKITNLPDELAYGTQPITLAFNRKGFTASIEGTSDVASIENGVLTIKKPGEVTITLSSGTEEKAENYTQKLKVTKRIVTLTEGLTVSYSDGKNSKEYDGTKSITLAKGSLKFAGKLGNDAAGLSLADYTSGTMADANVGEGKLVTIANAKLVQGSDGKDSTAFYELAPITIVKATVTPKPITITATDKSVAYGETIEYAVDNYSSSLVSGDKLDGTLKFSCAVSTDTTAGEYAGAITPYGLTSPNYAIKFEAGNLTVQAIAPSIEITEAKVVTAGTNKNIELKARLIHNGGASTAPTVSFKNGETALKTDVTAGNDGLYAATISATEGTTYLFTASAIVGGKTGTSSVVIVTIYGTTPQNLSWAPSVLPTLVYGQTMTIAATSDQAAANGAYTYRVVAENGETLIASMTGGVLKARKVGKVTITAERDDDDNYSVATLKKTIEITPKPITVSVSGLDKVYDGTTTIDSPIFTLTGVESGDDVSVNKANLTLSYASKNAGDNVAVILPELTLTGADAANYTLVQPKNVTGKITKPRLTIKVKDVTRPWNQRHTKYEFEAPELIPGETLAQAYTGSLKVTENGSTLELNIDATKSQNYDVTAENGKLTITKGMPKAVVYGSGSSWHGMIVDYQGYATNELELDESSIASSRKALIKLKNGQVLASSINSVPESTSGAASFSLRSAALRAGTIQWDSETFNPIAYGSETQYLTYPASGYNYESTNPSVLTYADGKITPVGVGNATIIATSTGGTEVHICNFTVLPKELALSATMDKTYDGTATATGTVALKASDIVGRDNVALDLSGITFNYDSKNVGENKPVTPSQPLVLIGPNANNYTLSGSLKGDITQKEITVNDPIAVYYNGQKTHTLTTYPATGLVAGDVAPITVTFASAAVGTPNITIALTSTDDAANYTLASPTSPSKGTIQRSTLVATLPTNASSVNDLKNNITLAIRETGESPISAGTVAFDPTITTTGSGTNTVYSVTGGETTNYSVVYDRNQIGYAAAPVIPGGGGGTVDPEPEIPTVSNPVVAERTATTAAITWEKISGATSYKLFLYAKKTDSTPLKTYEFDKDGKLKATTISFTLTGLEEGKSYYIETAAYNALGTLLVKKSVELSATPTGIEAISEGSQLYTVKGAIVVAPAEPLRVAIYSVTGLTLFNDEVSYLTQVPAQAGIYVVVIQKGKDRITEKVFVK